MIDESIKAIKRTLDIHKAPTGVIYGHKFLNHIKALIDEVDRLQKAEWWDKEYVGALTAENERLHGQNKVMREALEEFLDLSVGSTANDPAYIEYEEMKMKAEQALDEVK